MPTTVYVLIRQPDLSWNYTADVLGVFSSPALAEEFKHANREDERGQIVPQVIDAPAKLYS